MRLKKFTSNDYDHSLPGVCDWPRGRSRNLSKGKGWHLGYVELNYRVLTVRNVQHLAHVKRRNRMPELRARSRQGFTRKLSQFGRRIRSADREQSIGNHNAGDEWRNKKPEQPQR